MASLTLPAEGTYSDIERDLIENEPPGLFPENQDSVWGQMRKVNGDYLQVNFADRLAVWYQNLDPSAVDVGDLPEWEYMLDVPDSTGHTDAARRAFLVSRREQGPFTYQRRNRLIETFIAATFGVSLGFDAGGLVLDAGGLILLADVLPLSSSYRVYEDIQGWTYELWIVNTITPDTPGLTRELNRITPSGIVMTFDNTHANILDFFRTMRNFQPLGYWRLGTLNDSSGYAHNGTANGGVAAGSVASPGLLSAAIGGVDAATDFDGVNDSISIATNTAWQTYQGPLAFHAKFNLDALPAAAHYRPIMASNTVNSYLAIDSAGKLVFSLVIDGIQRTITDPAAIALATTYSAMGVWDGKTMTLYKNGVAVASLVVGDGLAALGTQLFIGAGLGDFYDGKLDEIAVLDHAPTAAQILALHNTSVNIA